jgi:hypothetical protein
MREGFFKLSLHRPPALLSLQLGAGELSAVVLYSQLKVHCSGLGRRLVAQERPLGLPSQRSSV